MYLQVSAEKKAVGSTAGMGTPVLPSDPSFFSDVRFLNSKFGPFY